MTLYYTLVFLILLLEILYFFVLMLPLPTEWRKKLFRFISRSPIMGRVKYTLKIVFGFIIVLFTDSVNRLWTIDATLLQMGGEVDVKSVAGSQTINDARTDASYSARKFYAQRNMYLTGSTLFLTLIIRHAYDMTVELVRLQDVLAQYEEGAAVREKMESSKSAKISPVPSPRASPELKARRRLVE
ncbi:B-cell receptor-associated protein 31-like-domain-containing protein [Fennellomyces sp. T-0311]|nr:B-cell receptor-associated protein 31-like-domain-containing protein [Fennellomyces sp. T-0311]